MRNQLARPFGHARVAIAGLGAIVFAMGAGAVAAAVTQPSLEQAVKASFLFKFAPFVEWPSSAWSTSGRNFNICLRGDDPFGATLDDVVRGQRISGRTVTVRRLAQNAGVTGCQMLFAGRSGEAAYAPFADVAGHPVLTVTDRANGVPGAMIQFVMQGGRVRFQIDDSEARENGLVISSKLLGLAVSVDRK